MMKVTMGQLPEKCFCHLADGTLSCDDHGCSVGTNDFCANGFVLLHHDSSGNRNGCNCPNRFNMNRNPRDNDRHHNNRHHNDRHNDRHGQNTNRNRGAHNGFVGRIGYHYETCTAFGGNARNSHGQVPAAANAATHCCNFCCGRNDTEPFPTVTVATPAPTSNGLKITSNKSTYSSILFLMVLTVLNINYSSNDFSSCLIPDFRC